MIYSKTTSFFPNPFSIYVAFWVLYRLQDLWTQAGGLVSQLVLFALLLVSFRHAYLLYSSSVRKPMYMRGLWLLLLMYTIYGFSLVITDGMTTQGLSLRPPTYYFLKDRYMSLLPIVSCYYYTVKGYLNEKTLRIWCFLFLGFGLIEYYLQKENIALEMMSLGLSEDNVNNVGYVMVSIMPCFLILKKGWLQYVGIAICFLFVVFSMKRGAIICALIIVVLYTMMNMRTLKTTRKFGFVILLVLLGVIVYNILQDTILQNEFFQNRLEDTMEGNLSGRDELIRSMLIFYSDKASFIQQLFGVGADGTLKISINYAHNDWVEILIDHGALGICLFMYYWFCFTKTAVGKKMSDSSQRVLLIIASFTFAQTFFSMSIGSFNIYISSILGYALADGYFLDKQRILNWGTIR